MTGTQVYGAAPTYDHDPPASLPDGIDALTGQAVCTTSTTAATGVGTYQGRMSDCDGVTPAGAQSSNHVVAYTGGGFEVTPATLLVAPDDQSIVYGDPDPTFTFTITGYENGDGDSAITSQPSCVAGAHTEGGTYAITCTGGSAADYVFDVSPTATLTVEPAPQTITFGGLADQLYGAVPITVAATASSGLTVAFSSLTPSVCSVSGTTATLLVPGTCTVEASQGGNASYAAATAVPRSFTVGFSSPCIITRVKGSITVRAGEAVCIDGGTVDKDVTVEAGGSLWVDAGTIRGAVSSSSARSLSICDSTVGGSLKVLEATGPITIGGGEGCANAIGGSVAISDNTGGVTYTFNVVGAAVTITSNSGGFVYGSNDARGKVTLKDNT